MSKRKYEEAFDLPESSSSTSQPSKYSLDSDEDDNDSEENDILIDEDIEGQEEGAAGIDDGIKITPFNMKEELEEGHFDAGGMYHWKKEKNVKDNWLDNIDWEKVRETDKREDDSFSNGSGDDSIKASLPSKSFNILEAYKGILEYMLPNETVAQALRRLGGSKKTSRAERWRKIKAGETLTEDEKIKQEFSKLTELADGILGTGNMNIYQETYKDICNEVKSLEKPQALKAKKPEKEELDMYADDFGAKEQARLKDAKKSLLASYSSSSTHSSDSEEERKGGENTMWEYKETEESDIVYGPYNSEHMLRMVTSRGVRDQVWVRKSTSCGEFYSSRRIDFGGDIIMWEYKETRESDIVCGPYDSEYMLVLARSKGEVWVRECNSTGEFYSSKEIDFNEFF